MITVARDQYPLRMLLAEELLLVLLDRSTGRRSKITGLPAALAAAVLVELAATRRLALDNGQVTITGDHPLLGDAPRSGSLFDIVDAMRSDIHVTVLRRMADRGVLVGGRRRWLLADDTSQHELRQRIDKVLRRKADPDGWSGPMITLLNGLGAVGAFSEHDSAGYAESDEIAAGKWPGDDITKAVARECRDIVSMAVVDELPRVRNVRPVPEVEPLPSELLLAEELLLLLVPGLTGATPRRRGTLTALAGAVLVELADTGQLEVDDDWVTCLPGDGHPLAPDLADGLLDDVILRLGATLYVPVLDRLVEHGALTRKRMLGVRTWRLADEARRDGLLAELAAVLLDRAAPDGRTAPMITLLDMIDATGTVFDGISAAGLFRAVSIAEACRVSEGTIGAIMRGCVERMRNLVVED